MEIQLKDLEPHLKPLRDQMLTLEGALRDRLQATEQVAADLRERAATLETKLGALAANNPAAETALQLATEARQMADQALQQIKKKLKEAEAAPADPVPTVSPPSPRQDPTPDPNPNPDPGPDPIPRMPWWKRLG